MSEKRVTIREIAREAGVSTATVSRVVNGKGLGRVGNDVAERVLEIVRKRGYRPNASARGLVSGRSRLVGVLVLGVRGSRIHVDILTGVERVARDNGYGIILGLSSWKLENEIKSINLMLEKGVDGILWVPVGTKANPQALDKLHQANCPMIWMSKDFASGHAAVTGDDFRGGYMAARHCHEKGHGNIAFIAVEGDSHANLRRKGFLAYIHENSLPDRYLIDIDVMSTPDLPQIGACELLDKNPEITAIVCSSDQLAMGVYHAAALKSRRIGEDLCLVGYGNYNYASLLKPSLSTFDPKWREIGSWAMESLLKQLDNQSTTEIKVTPELIVRESTGL